MKLPPLLELKLERDFPVFISGSYVSIGSKQNALAVGGFHPSSVTYACYSFQGERACVVGDGDIYGRSTGKDTDSFSKILH